MSRNAVQYHIVFDWFALKGEICADSEQNVSTLFLAILNTANANPI